MGKKVKNPDEDPILAKLNGSLNTSKPEESPTDKAEPIEDVDPILQKLNSGLKKKDNTASAPSSGGGTTPPGSPDSLQQPPKESAPSSAPIIPTQGDPLGIGQTIFRQIWSGFADQIPKSIAQSAEVGVSAMQPANTEEYIRRQKSVEFQRYVREKEGMSWYQAFDIDKAMPKYKDQFIEETGLEEVKQKLERKQPEIVKRRQELEQYVQEQNKESAEKLGGIPQSYKDVKSVPQAAQYAANMGAQGVWQIPLVIITKGLSGLAMEAAEVYDNQLDAIAEKENITREEVIAKNLDKPAQGQFYAVAAAGLDRLSAGGLLDLIKKGGSSTAKKIFAVTQETLTEPLQGTLEEMGGAKGADQDVGEAFEKAWTVNLSKRIDEAAGGFFAAGPLSVVGDGRTTNEVIKEKIEKTDTEDVASLDNAAEEIQAKFEEENNSEPVKPVEQTLTEETPIEEPASAADETLQKEVEPESNDQLKEQFRNEKSDEGKIKIYAELINQGDDFLEESDFYEKNRDQIMKELNPNSRTVRTDKGMLDGTLLSEKNVGGETVSLPKPGLVVSYIEVNKDERGKGHGKELYKKALDEFGVVYTSNNIDPRAMNAQNALVKDGYAVRKELPNLGGLVSLEKVTPSETKTPLTKDIVDQGKTLREEADQIKEKWFTKKGTFKKATPKDVISRASEIEGEYNGLKKQFNDTANAVDLEELPFTKRIVEAGDLQQKTESFFNEEGEVIADLDKNEIQSTYDRRVAIEREDYNEGRYGQTESPAAEARFESAIEQINNEFKGLEFNQTSPENAYNDSSGSTTATDVGNQEQGDEQPTNPEPNTPPPTEQKEPGKQRKFAKQILKDADISEEVKKGLSDDAKTYIPKGVAITNSEARAIIDVKGAEQAMADYLDTTNEMAADTRAVLGQNLIRHFNSVKDFDNAVRIADNLAKWYTEMGRAVNAAKVFQLLTPEGVLRYVAKEVSKAKAEYTRKTAGERKNTKDAIDRINKDAIEKVLKNPKVAKRIVTEAKKGNIKKAIDFLEKLKIDQPKGMASAQVVPLGLPIAMWNTTISLIQDTLQAGLTISQAVNKALAKLKKNGVKVDEEKFRQYFDEKLKDFRVVLDPQKAIKEELGAQGTTIDKIIREHYTDQEAAKTSLIDKLVKDANIPTEEAEAIRDELKKAMDELTKKAKERALKKYLPKEAKGTEKKAKKGLVDSVIEASNIGALSEDQYRETINEKIGVKSLDDVQAKKLTELADTVQKAPEGFAKGRATEKLLTFINDIKGYSILDVGMAIWYANILSGISTQILNISANINETVGEAFVSTIHNPKEAGFILKGLFSGWGRGLLETADTVQKGFQPTKYESKISASPILERVDFKGGKWNPYNYLKYVTRFMAGADIFFYQGLNEMRAHELAVKLAKGDGKGKLNKNVIKRAKEIIYKGEQPWKDALAQAKSEGWKGRDLKRRTYEILEQARPEFLIKDSNDAGAKGTFNYDPEGTLGALTSLVNLASEKVNIKGLKPIKFIVPFTRIIANVTNRYLDWTPVGLLRAAKGGIGFESLGENYHREYTPEERARVTTKAITGLIAMTAMYALTDDEDGIFEITADGTGDTFKNYELQESGWRPYSIKINNTWYEYKNTPLAIPFAILGYIRDLEKYRGEKDFEAKASILLFGTMKYVMDLSFLQSLSSFFDAFSKDNISSADSFFKKSSKRTEATVKSFIIPNAFTQVSRGAQEIMNLPVKRANAIGDQIIRDLPLLRDHLGNIYNSLGEPVIPTQVERFIPFKPSKSTEESERVWALIIDNNAWIGRPGRGTVKPNGSTMTDEEYDKFALLSGQLTKVKLELEYNYISRIKDKQEIKAEIRRIKTEARREARQTLFGWEIF